PSFSLSFPSGIRHPPAPRSALTAARAPSAPVPAASPTPNPDSPRATGIRTSALHASQRIETARPRPIAQKSPDPSGPRRRSSARSPLLPEKPTASVPPGAPDLSPAPLVSAPLKRPPALNSLFPARKYSSSPPLVSPPR